MGQGGGQVVLGQGRAVGPVEGRRAGETGAAGGHSEVRQLALNRQWKRAEIHAWSLLLSDLV